MITAESADAGRDVGEVPAEAIEVEYRRERDHASRGP
jgi:hypothetical protein